MTQQINLFGPMFRKQKRSLASSATLPVVLGAVAVVAAALYAIEFRDRAELRARVAAAEAPLKTEQTRAQQLAAERTASKKSPELEVEIGKLEQRLKALNENVAVLSSGALGDTKGFSEYMRAFARQSVSGLWLTGFAISGAGSDITIKGRVLNADLVPNYLRRLGQEPVLRGRSFEALQISRPRPDDAKDVAKDAAKPPRFLEFNLASAATLLARDGATAGADAPTGAGTLR